MPGPSTSISEPAQRTSSSSRPASNRRPRTSRPRKPPTARPDTSASGIGELPEQEFYPEEEDLEEGEEYEDESEEDENTFAFRRPQTAAVPVVAFGNTNVIPADPSTPPTMPGVDPMGSTGLRNRISIDTTRQETGPVEIGTYFYEPDYDPRDPPALSGRNNPNNSPFAFSLRARGSPDYPSPAAGPSSPPPVKTRPITGRSILSQIQRREATTAGTHATGNTHLSATSAGITGTSWNSTDNVSDSASFSDVSMSHASSARRIRSKTRLLDGGRSDMTSDAGQSRGVSRGSYGLTEFTGPITVADGKTTYGDGRGNVSPLTKYGSEEEGIGQIDWDPLDEDSPYPEVRASVSNLDDVTMPAFTIRAAVLGYFFVIVCSTLNTFFFFRFPSPTLNAIIVEMLVYPVGRAAAAYVPITVYTLPTWMPGKLSGAPWTFNDGPFNVKEHALIVIMANVGVTQAYGLHLVVAGELFYGRAFGFGFAFLLILCSQLFGFSLAGFANQFVVTPASQLWPEALSVTANLNAFHAQDDAFPGTGKISRIKLLVIVLIGALFWFWVPGYLFLALSSFSWVCWIFPRNRTVNALFGTNFGLGMSAFTFDWSQISLIGNPLIIPFWAQVNIICGFLLFYWLIVPLIYFTNTWYTSYIPVNTEHAADRYGQLYEVQQILGENGRINETAYQEYSPIFVSATLNMTYTVSYALTTAMIVHTALWHGPRIWRGIRNKQTETPDIHAKLMTSYKTVPKWWYGVISVALFALAIVCVQVFDTDLPVYGLIVALILPTVYFLPAAFLYASTAQIMTLNLISQLVPGFLVAGRPIAVMLSKVLTLQILSQGLVFVQDMKLGHYMKIPPRSTFYAQFSATILSCLIQVATKTFLFKYVPNICSDERQDGLTCDLTKTFFTSTVIWGVIGPRRLFTPGGKYHAQTYALIAGAVAPVVVFFVARRWPRSWVRNINIPVFLNGPLFVPPGTGSNYASFFIVGSIFQGWMRRRRFAWWSKYNYIIAAGLDAGSSFGAITGWLFFVITRSNIDWWGTRGYLNTIDFSGDSQRFPLQPGETFGPDTWT